MKADSMTVTELPLPALADRSGYLAAVGQARSAALAYYKDGTSALDDTQFDRLMHAIAAYELLHPDHRAEDSPTGRVAAGVLEEGEVPHAVPMLSLDDIFDLDALDGWWARLTKRLGHVPLGLHGSPKLDGLAVCGEYVHGRLVRLSTRGHGWSGKDVSHAIGTIDGLPTELSAPVTVEVRGEVVLTAAQFEEANRIRAEHGKDLFSTARNAAAGSLQATTGRSYQVPLSFFGYGLLSQEESPGGTDIRERMTHTQLLDTLRTLGVRTVQDTPVGTVTVTTLEEVRGYIDAVARSRASLPVGIDGIVIKADHPLDQRTAGESSRSPRWAVAYKLPSIERTTRLRAVTWATGRTGLLAPLAELEPVDIDGVTVTYATPHNAGQISRLGLMLGDLVTVRRNGDVIPGLVGPVVSVRAGAETPIPLPQVCPTCSGPIDQGTGHWRCVKGRACTLAPSVQYAVGREQLDIEGMGPKIVEQLLAAGALADVADLFRLTEAQLTAVSNSAKTAAKILARIEAAKQLPLNRVLCALGVRGTGRSMSRRIARRFVTMAALQAADARALQQVEGIGPEKSALVLTELAELAPVIAKLAASGVTLTEPAEETSSPGGGPLPLASKTVVATGTMTGALAGWSRAAVNALIVRAGGTAGSSVSSSTTLVVAGDKAGSKKAQAEKLKITVLSPDEFADLVKPFL